MRNNFLLIVLVTFSLTLFAKTFANEKEIYIISFKKAPLAANAELFRDEYLARNYRHSIQVKHQDFISHLENRFGQTFNLIFDYHIAFNGMSLALTPSQAQFITEQPDVLKISRQKFLQTTTDATPSMINADSLWSGVAISPLNGVKGEDIVVGVIDTGINMPHPSFSDLPEDNYDFASHNPFGIDNFKGWCNPSNPNYEASYVCNNKLIGAWDFIDGISSEDDGPIDSNFHGSHMSGIISGNNIAMPIGGFVPVSGPVLKAPFISGIAPHSHIIMYDVCSSSTGCATSAILAAIDQAILDGVDVINLSMEGGLQPWEPNSVAMALLHANNLGIITSTAAGNATHDNLAVYGLVNNLAPWVVTAANSFHGRTLSNDVSILQPMPVPDFLIEMYSVLADGVTILFDLQAEIYYAKDINSNNEEGCLIWNPNDFDSAIALIKSGGICSNQDKVQNAENAGAIAVIIFDAENTIATAMSGINSPTIPSTMIGLDDANNVISHIQTNSGQNTLVEILSETKHKIIDALGLVLYHRSLTGPNNAFNISKPDIAAPGTNIFAAIFDLGAPEEQYLATNGTSQSTAAVTGALVLLKNIHPGWSPSELKSALMLNANDNVLKENGHATNSDDIGSGIIDVAKAANSALVLNESYDNYLIANPENGGSPKTLNLASLRDNQCIETCSWQRTFTNKSSVAHSWDVTILTDNQSEVTVSESNFTLLANQSITLDINFSRISGNDNQHKFAKIILTDSNAESPSVQLTMVVYLFDLIFMNGFE